MDDVNRYDVFVSYRRADTSVAQALTRLIRAFGQRVFLDLDCIALGRSWDDTIQQAAREASTLLVLWSRNAANSAYMQSELRFVRETCRIVPVLLDGSPLPPELAAHQAVSGLQAHERLISRVSELVRVEKKSQQAAVEQVVEELKRDGIELTQEQRNALGLFVKALGGVGLLASLIDQLWSVTRRPAHAAVSKQGIAVVMGLALAFFGGRLAADMSSPETTTAPLTACPPTEGYVEEQSESDAALNDQKTIRTLRTKVANQKVTIKERDETIQVLTRERDEARVRGSLAQNELGVTKEGLRARDLEIVRLRENQCKPVPRIH